MTHDPDAEGRTATTERFALDLAARLQPRTGQDALLPVPREPQAVASVYSVAPIRGGGFGVLEHWRRPREPSATLSGRHFLPLALAMRAAGGGA